MIPVTEFSPKDFMVVRKIPLKERASFPPAEDSQPLKEDSEDSEIEPSIKLIRKQVLTDRALHDKVNLFTHVKGYRSYFL